MHARVPSRPARLALPLGLALAALVATAVGSEAAATTITAISAGDAHGCALLSDASVRCWGDDEFGQLGDGSHGDPSQLRLVPVQVRKGSAKLTSVKAIDAGSNHTCALRTDATVWCWGDDEHGQLGDGSTGDATHDRLKAVEVRLGGGFLSQVKGISAGQDHSCAVRTDGTAWCWGWDDQGQLGDGTHGGSDNARLLPVQVRRGSVRLTAVKAISAGDSHTCAVLTDFSAWCWGWDAFGQLGDGSYGDAVHQDRLKAVQVHAATGPGGLTGATTISAGSQHTCATLGAGEVWCWGDDQHGQLGGGTHVGASALPLHVGTLAGGSGASSVRAGGQHTCATVTGAVYCWGFEDHGQLGNGTVASADQLSPVAVDTTDMSTAANAIVAGYSFSCAITSGHQTAWCWGSDAYGQIGDGTTGDGDHARPAPVKVVLPT